MLRQSVLCRKPFFAFVTRESDPFVSGIMPVIITFLTESFATQVTPVTEHTRMLLEMQTKTLLPTKRLVTFGALVSPRKAVEHAEDVRICVLCSLPSGLKDTRLPEKFVICEGREAYSQCLVVSL